MSPYTTTSWLLGCSLLLSACAVGPDFQAPANTPLLGKLATPAGPQLASTVQTQPTNLEQWWAVFNDATLNQLQQRALAQNLDWQLAQSRVEQSRAQLGIAEAAGLPRLGLSANPARQALSADGPMAKLGAPSSPQGLWQAGFDSSWEIDFWGSNRRSREAVGASLQASQYQAEGVRVSVAAELARNYLLLRSVQQQTRIAEQTQKLAQRNHQLTERRASQGLATQFDTRSAQAQQASIQASLPRLQQQSAALMNAIALLLGEAPRSLDGLLAQAAAPRLPAQIALGLPSDLARRRPDILQAEAKLHAATANIGVAKADFYPRISLTGSFGWQALDRSDFGNWSSRYFSIGPSLYLPIFEGGRLRRMLALSEARQQEAAIQYQQTVLRAWHEVDDALHAYANEQWRLAQLQQTEQQRRLAHHSAQRRYQQGASNFLSVLNAEQTWLSSQRELSEGQANVGLALVGLYKALGGGWDTRLLAANTKEAS